MVDVTLIRPLNKGQKGQGLKVIQYACSISATLLSTVGYDRIVRSAKNARLDEYSNSRAQVRVFLLTACPAKSVSYTHLTLPTNREV